MDNIAIVTPLSEAGCSNPRWEPKKGSEVEKLFGKLPLSDDAKAVVYKASISVLARGISPELPDGRATTGLVVGYVQSGKTLSFTTTIALARDNGFQLVIVIAGTSTALFDQSSRRLFDDLSINDEDAHFRWDAYENPANNRECRHNIQQTLDAWGDASVTESQCATVLMIVMKNHQRMDNLVGLLKTLNLEGKSALIIDDEADQASLNTKIKQGKQSVTYRRFLDLRASVPHHALLQYTATPQAPLLINIIDVLSPQFVEVLESGEDYVGGEEFFGSASDLVKVIPEHDVPSTEIPTGDLPESLLDALMVFLVGVAAGLKQGRHCEGPRRRSMLVHPSQRKEQHGKYCEWIRNVLDEWTRELDEPETNRDRKELIEDFEEAYDELVRTVPNLMPFEEILPMLNQALTRTRIQEINTRMGRTPVVKWNQAYSWILVGGQAMGRGYTIEGLTVTYMPRGRGMGNVDAIQQRARFFGYKRAYLGLCRVYLEQGIRTDLQHYVRHEEYMRKQLKEFSQGTKPLKDWKRRFVLEPTLKPCRRDVIEYLYIQGHYTNKWFFLKALHAPPEVTSENEQVLKGFTEKLGFERDKTFESSRKAQQHLVCHGVRLSQLLEQLLLVYRIIDASDTQEMMGLLLQLSEALEQNRDDIATVYWMRPDHLGSREVDANGRINSIRRLLEGPTKGGNKYPGDFKFCNKEHLSLQIHHYNLTQGGKLLASNVPAIAAWVPSRMGPSWLVQHQEGQRV